jgi:hypothetical protein
MKPLPRLLVTSLLLTCAVMLSACGTTSGLKSAAGAGSITSTRTFSKVTVQDYSSAVARDSGGSAGVATRHFADLIASEIRRTGGFSTVGRNASADGDTLVIDGTITRYAEGSAALRYLVGMGAGSSYFDATTRFKDGAGNSLGQIITDKNSWGLGGGIAATQTPETFMVEASQKIAAEARKLAR